MYPRPPAQPRLNNPEIFDAHQKAEMEKIIDELASSATDPYKASLPLMISASLNDQARYKSSCTNLFKQLKNLQEHPENFEDWMKNNSFKAWMLGRALLAANTMRDDLIVDHVKNIMPSLLEAKAAPEDNPAFAT